MIERNTRLYTAVHMPDCTVLSMEIVLDVAISQYPQGPFSQPRLTDRGKEFACYGSLETTHNLHV
ncbi:hypothetical protein M1D71_13370 [Paenibacillus sp. Z3-2]